MTCVSHHTPSPDFTLSTGREGVYWWCLDIIVPAQISPCPLGGGLLVTCVSHHSPSPDFTLSTGRGFTGDVCITSYPQPRFHPVHWEGGGLLVTCVSHHTPSPDFTLSTGREGVYWWRVYHIIVPAQISPCPLGGRGFTGDVCITSYPQPRFHPVHWEGGGLLVTCVSHHTPSPDFTLSTGREGVYWWRVYHIIVPAQTSPCSLGGRGFTGDVCITS